MKMPANLLLIAALMTGAGALRAEPQTVKLTVSNMSCALCPFTVRRAIANVPGVLDAKVDYGSKTAVVRFDDGKTSVDAITEATKNAGYPSKPLP